MSNKYIIVPEAFERINLYQFSDGHFENLIQYHGKPLFDKYFSFPKPDPKIAGYNILMLCGDMFEWKRTFKSSMLMAEICSCYDHVFYVPGNHDHYGRTLENTTPRIAAAMTARNINNFTVLQNETAIVKSEANRFDEIAVIGSTFWANISANKESAMYVSEYLGEGKFRFSDFKYIRTKCYSRVRAKDITVEHLKSKAYVFDEIKRNKALGRKVAVITHHAPSFRSATHFKKNASEEMLNRIFSNSLTNTPITFNGYCDWDLNALDKASYLYCTDCEREIFEHQPDYWFHGHLHELRRYYIGKSLITCDPIGYHVDTNERTSGKNRKPVAVIM